MKVIVIKISKFVKEIEFVSIFIRFESISHSNNKSKQLQLLPITPTT